MQEKENQEKGNEIRNFMQESEYDLKRILMLCIIGVLFLFFEVKVFNTLRSKSITIILAGLFFGFMIFMYSASCFLSGTMILGYVTAQKFLKKVDVSNSEKKTYAWSISILLILLGLTLQSCFWAFVKNDSSLWLLTGVLLLGMILPIIKLFKYLLMPNKEPAQTEESPEEAEQTEE